MDIIVSDYRDCGECDLCCKLLETHGVPSPIGTYCQYCDNGCTIHDTRPDECREYQCMWSQMPEHFAMLELRPDKCGVIFDRQGDDVISARIDEGTMIKDLAMAQINNFNIQGFSVIVFRGNNHKIFLKDGHTEDYVRKIIDGRSQLLRRFN